MLLLFPALFFVVRYAISEGVSGLIAERLLQQRNAAVRVVNKIFTSTIFNVAVNVTVFLVAIYSLRDYLGEKRLVFVISMVYAASVLHASFKFARNAYWVYDVSLYIWRHGVHGPRAWLRSHVAGEVHARFQQMGWLKRLA